MPGDKVQIGEGHVAKATAVLPRLWEILRPILEASPHQRAVLAVHGGSGVGKSEIGSLLAHYLRANGIGAYVMSGDNYPRRIPRDSDAERLRTFRTAGVRGLVDAGLYDDSVRKGLTELQTADRDADPAAVADSPWLTTYQRVGRAALDAYLGTPNEIDFAEVSGILARFHDGATSLQLKRMGRELGELWYSSVDVSEVSVLVVEWTHGNSDHLVGVDVPILLNSTPEETLAHRRARARDGATDSPFTTMVLALEQAKLASQAPQGEDHRGEVGRGHRLRHVPREHGPQPARRRGDAQRVPGQRRRYGRRPRRPRHRSGRDGRVLGRVPAAERVQHRSRPRLLRDRLRLEQAVRDAGRPGRAAGRRDLAEARLHPQPRLRTVAAVPGPAGQGRPVGVQGLLHRLERVLGGPRNDDRGPLRPAGSGAHQGHVLPQARPADPHGAAARRYGTAVLEHVLPRGPVRGA